MRGTGLVGNIIEIAVRVFFLGIDRWRNKILDDAAMRIAKMAAPYAPFPDELSKKFEVLRIPRTWKFSNGSTNISAR
jgi:hypothetical protein